MKVYFGCNINVTLKNITTVPVANVSIKAPEAKIAAIDMKGLVTI